MDDAQERVCVRDSVPGDPVCLCEGVSVTDGETDGLDEVLSEDDCDCDGDGEIVPDADGEAVPEGLADRDGDRDVVCVRV